MSSGFVSRVAAPPLLRQSQQLAKRALWRCRRKWRTYHKCPCRSEIPQERTVLMIDRCRDQAARRRLLEPRAQIVFALVVGGEVAAQERRLPDVMDARKARQRAN